MDALPGTSLSPIQPPWKLIASTAMVVPTFKFPAYRFQQMAERGQNAVTRGIWIKNEADVRLTCSIRDGY